jgi:hypothetical protein
MRLPTADESRTFVSHCQPEVLDFAEVLFCVHGSVNRESMSVIVQQDVTSYSFYSMPTALHVSGDTFTHHQEHE